MYKSCVVLLITFLFPSLSNAGSLNKAKFFGIVGFSCSIIAIGADIAGEHYFDKYEEAILPADCRHFRRMTKICEVTRDASFGLAVTSFSISTIFLLKGKNSDSQIEIGCKGGHAWVEFTKLFY
jgi:hypothetical protein